MQGGCLLAEIKNSLRTAPFLLMLLLCPLSGALAQQSGPVTIEHRWGTTRIDGTPERVVTLSYIGVDYFLALGVAPIAFRYWYGGNEKGVWPWAETALGAHEPVLLRGEVDVEQIAALKPDLIEAVWSGISEDEYRQLSSIAPVIAPKKEYGAYGTPWSDMLEIIGVALGQPGEANSLVRDLRDRIKNIRESHPGWQGRTAAVGWAGGPGFYTGGDVRGQLMEDLGFVIPEGLEKLSLGNFYVNVSRELTEPYDTDVLLWLDSGGAAKQLKALPLRHTMRAYAEGREIVVDPVLAAAMSYSSPLSLGYVFDRLIPLLEAASDGDPQTKVPSSLDAGSLQ